MKSRIGAVLTAGVLTVSVSGCGVFRGDEDSSAPGVTKDACPNAVNKNNGCIYLGAISDLTVGPFKTLAVPITEAQKAFWKRVNQQGGIGGYDIDVTKYVRDNKYNPETHNQVYQEIKGKVLALAQTLGSPTTAAIIKDLKSSKIVAAPASWTSAWNFEDVILESGASYCIESMNAIDYAVETFKPKSVMAVHYAGDYGADAAAGAKAGAAAQKLTFNAIETPQGQDNQGRAVDAIVKGKPDLVILTTGPTDAATVIGQAAARGYKGRYIGTSPSWNKGLLKSPAAPAIKAQYLQSAPWAPFQTQTPGHQAMRQALGQVDPNDGYTSGWVWSYPLKAALQKAAANKELTRDGLLKAVKQITQVDYEGMMPTGSGNFAGDAGTGAVRTSLIAKPDDKEQTGVKVIKEAFTGPTAKAYTLDAPCFGKL
ncbi:ABC transporter substrate-binding protein [Actinomadura rudentiformis]|uniref:ABC transporter substrate-binding protein n=1 Tax=Actinomadura rudentiformis TaxID=359158 RepID=A0A6H9YKZ7_9ACTN|nr:ABC transporter substrate-binding protein [Actinomadura rudentiformis]KAB2345215.1 ABC transporter substrate-binding protein [Actinomadura rudentiformis]